MTEWNVSVEGGGHDLFRICQDDETYTVYQEYFRFTESNHLEPIGEEGSFEEAIDLIKSSSGEDIMRIVELE